MKKTLECPMLAALEADAAAGEAGLAALEAHLDACAVCRRAFGEGEARPGFADTLRKVNELREKTLVDVNISLERINELAADYEVIEEIGRGGMGVVFRARQRHLDREVAMKILPALVGVVKPELVERFRREAMVSAKLRHANIIPVFDFGELQGTFFYTMELVRGRSLRQILEEIAVTGSIDAVLGACPAEESAASRLHSVGNAVAGVRAKSTSKRGNGTATTASKSPTTTTAPNGNSQARTRLGSATHTDRAYYRRVASWMADVAEAIQAAHAQGILHRDIKPANLLVAEDGRLMISDFGLASIPNANGLTRSQALIGTACYMSPEQVDSKQGPIDGRADVYALGATMYELLAFRPMFASEQDHDVLARVLHTDPAPPRRIVPRVPQELETICLKAIEKDRQARYGSAQEMADDLRRWLLDLPIWARRPSTVMRVRKWVKRRRLAVTLATACGLLACGLTYAVASYRSSQRDVFAAREDATTKKVKLLVVDAKAAKDRGEYQTAMGLVMDGLRLSPQSLELGRLRVKLLLHTVGERASWEAAEAFLLAHPNDWDTHFAAARLLAGDMNASCQRYLPSGTTIDLPKEARLQRYRLHRDAVAKFHPNSAELFCLLGTEEVDHNKAIQLFDRALSIDPSSMEVLAMESDRYDQLGDFAGMLSVADRFISVLPKWSSGYALRSKALEKLERFEDADSAISEAISRDPNEAPNWFKRSLLRSRMGRYAEALADADRVIAIDERFPYAFVARARARAGLGQVDNALSDLTKAISFRPTDIEVLHDRSKILFESGRVAESIEDATRIIGLAPEDARAFHNRAIARIKLGQLESAIADLNQCLRIDPRRINALRDRGHARALAGKYEEAIGDYSEAIRLDPTVPGDWISRSNLAIKTGDYGQAITDLTRLMENSEDVYLIVLRRGQAFELSGAIGPALADYERVAASAGPVGQYSRLWRYIVLNLTGEKAELGDKTLKEAGMAEEWPTHLAECLRGELSADELLRVASSEAETAEAHYYIGAKALIERRYDDARSAFKACLATKQNDLLEFEFARARLARLERRLTSRAVQAP